MRLRLSVQRHNLPTSNVLWSVPDTASPQAYTVARLLEDVNRILPLEAEQWGLEDYTVEVGGFECLHFQAVLQTLKEDDHVSIRPLLTAEVRSRTLCGRTQITEDGRHLIDGIPFGRPHLRQPQRPAVTIPPRKRRRIEQDAVGGGETPEALGLITEAGERSSRMNGSRPRDGKKEVQFTQADLEESDDSEDDEDFVPGHVSEGSIESSSDDDDAPATSETSTQDKKNIVRRRRMIEQPESQSESDSDSSSESETDTSSDSSLESDSRSESESDASVESESDASSDSDSDSDSESSNSGPEILSSKLTVPPFSGSNKTMKRNNRRRELVKLNRLKVEGKLPPHATYKDLRRYLQRLTEASPEALPDIPATKMAKSAGKRKRLGGEVEDSDMAALPQEDSAELEQRRQELMARLEDGTSEAALTPAELSNTMDEPAERSARASVSPVLIPSTGSKRPDASTTTPAKRLRPDISAIGRILQRQAVNVERKSPKSKVPTVEEAPEPEGASDPDFWKSRVNLSAFECWDEDHELSAPPFPFKQHWDPASKLMHENKQKGKTKLRKNKEQVAQVLDNKDEDEEETPILDYNDSPATMKAGSDPTDAIESQILQDVELANKIDLPPLPDDVESLATLQPSDISVGAIVVFKLFTIDPATVTPQISGYKTAIVEKEGDSGKGAGTFRLKLADRDVPKKVEKKTNRKGKPIEDAFSGFTMPMDIDEEVEDDSIWEGMFGELLSPKLLKAAD